MFIVKALHDVHFLASIVPSLSDAYEKIHIHVQLNIQRSARLR